MRPPTATRCTPQLLMGLAVLVTGVVFLLYNLGVADLRQYLGYWPWLLVLVGVTKLVRARSVPSALIGVFWIALAVWLKPRLFGVDLSVLRTYWPVILICLGLVIVWHTFQRRPGRPRGDVDHAVLGHGDRGVVWCLAVGCVRGVRGRRADGVHGRYPTRPHSRDDQRARGAPHGVRHVGRHRAEGAA